MEHQSKTQDIVKFMQDNMTATSAEIRTKFEVSRQRVEQIMSEHFDESFKQARKDARHAEFVKNVGKLIEEGYSQTQITSMLNVAKIKVEEATKSPEIQAILQVKEEAHLKWIELLSVAWLRGDSITDIIENFDWCDMNGNRMSPQNASGTISRYRVEFPGKFPLRRNNQESAQGKYDRYLAAKIAGRPDDSTLASELGFKTVASMKSAWYQLNHPKEKTVNV